MGALLRIPNFISLGTGKAEPIYVSERAAAQRTYQRADRNCDSLCSAGTERDFRPLHR